MKFSTTWQDIGFDRKLGEGVALPNRFTARFDFEGADHNVELDVAVHDGAPVCEAIRIERGPGRPPLSGAELRRLPLSRWIDYVCAEQALIREDGVIRVPREDEEQRVLAAISKPRRRRKLTDDFLREVMATWAEGEQLTPGEGAQHVVDAYGKSGSQVYRWRKAAQERGLAPKEEGAG